MKIKRLTTIIISCILVILLTLLCAWRLSPMKQLERVICDLKSGEAAYATAVLTDDSGNRYGTESVYIKGEDYLHIMIGPDEGWESTELYVDGVLYTGFTAPNVYYPLSNKYESPDPAIPWKNTFWEIVESTVISTERADGVIEIICQQNENDITYRIEKGKIVSIAYSGTDAFQNMDGEPVYHDFTRTFTFHQISDGEVKNVLEIYLEKVEE